MFFPIARIGASVTFGFLMLGFAAPVHAAEARESVDELIQGMEKLVATWKSQQSWMVRFKHTRDLKQVAPNSRGVYLPNEITTARKGPWFFAKEVQEFLSDSEKPRPLGQLRTSFVSWKEGVCVQRDLNYVQILAEPSAIAYQLSYYTGWLFLDLQDDMMPRTEKLKELFGADKPSDLFWEALPKSVINHKSEFKVRPELEIIDGAACHVLERPGKDLIWIDTAIGFVCRRRAYYQAPGLLGFEVDNLGFTEKAKGIWLPAKQVAKSYNLEPVAEEYRGKVAVLQTNVLLESHFNDLPDTFFDVPVPDGSTINDHIRGIEYQKHGNEGAPLEAVIGKARTEEGLNSGQRSWLEIAVQLGIVIGLVVLGWQVWRLRKRTAN